MTCIVGIKTKDNVYIGGDTFGSDGFTGSAYVRPKVFKKDGFVYGVCGSYRIMQLIEFNYITPVRNIGENTENFLYKKIPDNIRACLRNGGAITVKDNIETMDASFLFAYENRLFKFQADFSILEPVVNYAAIGSGCYHAEASLYSTEEIILDPEERIKKTIICANNYVLSINDKINIISLNEISGGKILKKRKR